MSWVTVLIWIISLLIIPLSVVLIITKLINYFSKQNHGFKKISSYYDFFTTRGLSLLIFAFILTLIGYNNGEHAYLLTIGIFIIFLCLISFVFTFFFKIIADTRRKQFYISIPNTDIYADQPLNITHINFPLVSKLIYLFPTRLSIESPERLGGKIEIEINKKFLKEPTIPFPLSKRGKYIIGPLTVSFSDFFGLVESRTHIDQKMEIRIFPHYKNITQLENTFLQQSYKEYKQVKKLINDESFYEIKEYAPGDDTRRINWKITARSDDKIYVKKPEAVNMYIHENIMIFIDTVTDINLNEITNEKFIDALDKQASIAATIANFYLHTNSIVKLAFMQNNVLKIYDLKNLRSMLQLLSEIDKSKYVISENSLQTLIDNRIIFINNSLSSSYYYNVFTSKFQNIIQSLTVQVGSFFNADSLPKDKKWYKKVLMTNDYFDASFNPKSLFAVKKNQKTLLQAYNNTVKFEKTFPKSIVVKSEDPIDKILNNKRS